MKLTKIFQLLLIIVLLFSLNDKIYSQSIINPELFNKLKDTHDVSLPAWGPYTKRYIGISHIPDIKSGIRFDLSVFPGFYRRKVDVPDVLYENDFHPWDASPDLDYFSFRHELEWKDQVYTDISYSKITTMSRLIRVEFVNNTNENENLALHFMASMNFPNVTEYTYNTPLYPALVTLPQTAQWFDALNYEDLKFFKTRPTDNLVYDGFMRGEIRDNGFVNGSGIGEGFGLDKGDFVSYKIKIEKDYNDAIFIIRYKLDSTQNVSFNLSGMIDKEITFNSTKDFALDTIRIGKLEKGIHGFTLTSNGGDGIQLDGFIIVESDSASKIKFNIKNWNPVPKIIAGPIKNSIILKYDDADVYYGLLWQFDLFKIREWYCRDLSDFFKQEVNEHVETIFHGEGKGHYTNVFLRPIFMKPKSTKIIYAMVCCGSKEEVEKYLEKMNESQDKYKNIYMAAKKHVVNMDCNPAGEKYKFSIERMNATLNSNVVYPVYMQKHYVRLVVPGRWWDCLYTWDAGFTGMGMLQSDTLNAIENLNTYVQSPGAQSAFILHGSPVPSQQYLLLELWNKTQSKELLEYFYPRLKQYHEFMVGRLGSSTTRSFKSDILKTWDYFYNSGGWDDLPPQLYTHDNNLESTVAPVITTAQEIRTAKILKMIAEYLGKKEDIKTYDNDIKIFTNALQKYSWDDKSGYFGYVVHDSDGNPLHILKYNGKTNYDMTFDGAYPLIAGICTPEQKEKILTSLESSKHLWSTAGLSAVDQSAPYYRVDGYWNGTVWMAHQWFFWKTMLDLGQSDFAYKIAIRALDIWKNEVEISYNCMEHFIIETGRGAGWHMFGSLSAPVVMWFSTYFRPGNFTTGFDIWMDNKKFEDDNTKFSVDLTAYDDNNQVASVVACMNPNYSYQVKWNGKDISYKSLTNGTLSIDIPIEKIKKGELTIKRK
jgi:neutral trehalase